MYLADGAVGWWKQSPTRMVVRYVGRREVRRGRRRYGR